MSNIKIKRLYRVHVESEVIVEATHILSEQMEKLVNFQLVKRELMEKLTDLDRRFERNSNIMSWL